MQERNTIDAIDTITATAARSAVLLLLLCLAACRQDDGDSAPEPKARISLFAATSTLTPAVPTEAQAPAMTTETLAMAMLPAAALAPAKAPATITDYSPLLIEDRNDAGSIALFFVSQDGTSEAPTRKNFFWSYNDVPNILLPSDAVTRWEPSDAIAEGNYNVYGFMPGTADLNASLTRAAVGQGATLSLTELPITSLQDVCVVVGVAREPDATKLILHDGSQSVSPGSYSFTAQEGDNTMYVLMHHLFARLTLKFSVGEQYDRLRTIKLRSVSMVMLHSTVDATVTLTTTAPYATASFTQTGSKTDLPIFSSDEGMELTTTAQEVNTFIAPMSSADDRYVTFRSTYDVYDKAGALVRKDCQSVNSWYLSPTLQPGDSYTITASVQPTYLYQLSDNDLDNLITLGN